MEDIDFGHGLERIGENGCRNMFAGCAISKLVLPPQIKKIGIAAFHCCHKLTELVLNDGLEEIETGAFVYCNRLMQVTLPKSIKKIGKSAFIINFKPGNPTPLGMGRRALFLQKNKKISYFFTLS